MKAGDFMNVFKQRMLNVERSLLESPAPESFTMGTFFHACRTPACAMGHYALREDLQDTFTMSQGGGLGTRAGDRRHRLDCDGHEIREHFGISQVEAIRLFAYDGCNRARTPQEAAAFIRRFAEDKWPETTPDWSAIAATRTVPEGKLARAIHQIGGRYDGLTKTMDRQVESLQELIKRMKAVRAACDSPALDVDDD
jgi:hypothetical protein